MKSFNDPEVFARVKRLPPALLAATERLRDATRARGVDVIDLATLGPGGAPPWPVLEALRSAAGDPAQHRSPDPRGLAALRAAAAEWYRRRHGVVLDAEREVLVTGGSEEGIAHALVGLLQERDAVLLPSPTAPAHAHAALLGGGEVVPVAVRPAVDVVESLVAATEQLGDRRARGLVVGFPAEPTGTTGSPDLLAKIVKFAEARSLFVVSDLAWGDLVLDGGPAPSVLQVPGARDRALEFVSLAASHHMAGWGVGVAAGNPALVAALARVRSRLGGAPFGPLQAAARAALDPACDAFVAAVRDRYRAGRDALVRHLGAAGWPVPAPAATAFAWAPLPEPARHLGSLEFARRLVVEAGVAVAPGLAFGAAGEGFARIALGEDEARIEAAARRIGEFLDRVGAEPRPAHTPAPRSQERA